MYSFSSLPEFATLRDAIKQELVEVVPKDAQRVFIAINEGINNAIFHGNQEDSTKTVRLTIERLPNELKIIIRDEGKGFLQLEQPENDLEDHGRGFAIIQHCVDSYQLNGLGNEITLIKKINTA